MWHLYEAQTSPLKRICDHILGTFISMPTNSVQGLAVVKDFSSLWKTQHRKRGPHTQSHDAW